MEAIVFLAMCRLLLEVFKMGEYHSIGEYFTVVAGAISWYMQLDKKRASKNI